MRKIILDLAVTLDGFIEGPNGEIDWCIMDEGNSFENFLEDVDTIFYGRISYDLWGQYQPGDNCTPFEKKIWQEVHSKQKYVFSKNTQTDGLATYISTDIENTVRQIKQQQGKNIWLYGGANLITTFINLKMIDIFQLAVHPVILGSGKPLFSNIQERNYLTLKEVKTSKSGVVMLTYMSK